MICRHTVSCLRPHAVKRRTTTAHETTVALLPAWVTPDLHAASMGSVHDYTCILERGCEHGNTARSRRNSPRLRLQYFW